MNAKTSASYRLGEVAGYAGDPHHEIPPLHYREDLEPGELALLMVEHPDETSPLWAEIREVLGPGWYLGATKNGSEVEFGAEHVFGMNGPLGMGASDPQPWWEHLPGLPRWASRGSGGPSIFDVWKRGAPAKPVPPPGGPAGSITSKKSFWDFFRRKPKVTLEPIPPGERREQREQHSFLRLPGQIPAPPAPMEAQVRAQEAYQAPQQAMIAPEVVSGFSVPEYPPSGLPDELFQVLAPPGPGSAPKTPAPGSMIVGPSSSLPAQMDAFSVLEPNPEPFGSQGLVPSFQGPRTPAQVTPISPFEMFQPEAPGASSFGMIQPGEPTPFDILEPTAAPPDQGLVVRSERGISSSSVFDILEPEQRELAPYMEPAAAAPPPPPGPTVFDAIQPEPPKPSPKRKKAAPKKQQPADWEVPTREEWVRWIKETFKPVENIWTHVRRERNSEYFLDEQLNEDDMGQPPLIPIETWESVDDFDRIFGFFEVPGEVWGPIADQMAEDNEKYGYADEAWERMQIDVLDPLENALEKAFKSIQPADLPGHFVLASDDGSNTWGLCYYEKLDPKHASRRQKEALQARERGARETKELINRRKAQIKKIWGAMPKPEDLVGWIEEKFDLDAMFGDIKKARRPKTWKQGIKEYGDAALGLEVIANLGPNRSKDYEYEIAAYFGIPPEIVSLYEESESGQELWNDIFWPFFESLGDAFAMLLPSANLPGMISVDEDDHDHLIIQYVETDEDEE